MVNVQVYPVLDGVELWIAGSCRSGEPSHTGHSGTGVHSYISRDAIDERGLAGALAYELTLLLHENPEVTQRAAC